MFSSPFNILLLVFLVVGVIYFVVRSRPQWRGYGLLICVVVGIILGNVGLLQPPPGLLPTLFVDITYVFVALMIMTVNVRDLFKIALKPLSLFWITAAGTMIGGIVAFLIVGPSLPSRAAATVAIIATGAFGHTETQLAVATGTGALAILPVIVAIATIRGIVFQLIGFGTVGVAERINRKFLKPTFRYADDQRTTTTIESETPGQVDQMSIGVSLGLAGLFVLLATLISTALNWGSTGLLALLVLFALAFGTFGGRQSRRLKPAAHDVGLYLSWVALTIVGASTSLAIFKQGALPILFILLITMVFTFVTAVVFGKIMKVDWATIAVTLVMADTGTPSGVAAAVAHGAERAIPVAVITSLSGSALGIYVGLAFVHLLTALPH